MENGALLGDVDLVAREHGVDVMPQAGLFGKLNQKTYRLGRDSVLRVVEVQTQSLQREAFAALRIVGEKLPEMYVADFRKMLIQRGPCRPVPRAERWCVAMRDLSFECHAEISARL